MKHVPELFFRYVDIDSRMDADRLASSILKEMKTARDARIHTHKSSAPEFDLLDTGVGLGLEDD